MHLNNKGNLQALREQINEALKAVGEANGIRLTCGNCTYDATVATFKLEAAEILDDGTVASREALSFGRYCQQFGLQPDDLGKSIRMNAETYTIIGLKPSCNHPILVERERDHKRFRLAAFTVTALLNTKPQ